MAYNYGLVGVATISSAGAVASSSSIRVHDLAFAGTTGAAAAIHLYNGVSSSSAPVIQLGVGAWYLHSDAGYKFPNGCFVVATLCTATINYIREF